MGFLLVMKAEIVRSWIMTRRYWFRSITGIIIGYGMLMVLIAGFIYSRDAIHDKFQTAEQATNYVLGFIIGMFAFGVVGLFSQGLQSMATAGVLEQLCMSPHGLITNFLARMTVGSVMTILSSCVLVWLVTISVGGKLYFDFLPVATLLALTFVNLLGFGFMVGGLVLVFKQVGQLAIILRMALFGLAIFASPKLLEQPLIFRLFIHALPVTDAVICLKYVLIENQQLHDGTHLSIFMYSSFFWLLGSCVVWNVIGLTLFKYMENYSRYEGTLGAY